jgi:superfamily I DNA/RNA helicase
MDYDIQNLDPRIIRGGESALEWRDKYKLGKLRERIGDVIPKEFAYGYAITCHKAQGSEWDKVLVVEENFPRVKEEHARWLYTAATRAVEKLVIRRNE